MGILWGCLDCIWEIICAWGFFVFVMWIIWMPTSDLVQGLVKEAYDKQHRKKDS